METATRRVFAIALPVLGTIISTLVVFLPEYSQERFSLAEQLLMCGATFLVIATWEILWFVKQMYELKWKEYAVWQVRDAVDEELRGIREAFTRITADSRGEEDLFVGHFRRVWGDVALQIGRAAHERELRVWSHHFGSVKKVMSVFAGDGNPTYWCTWNLQPGDRLFGDSHWKSYFSQIVAMVQAGDIRNVRTLLIVEDWGQLEETRLASLAAYYRSTQGMECAIILNADYVNYRRDAELPPGDVDFGIFGTRLLYRTESEEEKAGVFCRDEGLIARYREFFETIWDHPDTRKDVVTGDGVDTLEKLMEADHDVTAQQGGE